MKMKLIITRKASHPMACGCCSEVDEHPLTTKEWVADVLKDKCIEDRLAMLQDMFGILLEHVLDEIKAVRPIEPLLEPTANVKLVERLIDAVDPNAEWTRSHDNDH